MTTVYSLQTFYQDYKSLKSENLRIIFRFSDFLFFRLKKRPKAFQQSSCRT